MNGKFKFRKRQGQFEAFNNRLERHGPEERVKAIDLPVRHGITPRELDMLVPAQGVPLSQFLFGDNLRKPELQTPVLFPLKVYRKPEHILFTVYDGKGKKGLTFDDVKVKDPVVTIDLDENMQISYKLQFHPGHHLQRISDSVEGRICEFEVEAQQEELFGQASEEDEDPDAPPAPAQGELVPSGGRPRVPDDNQDLGVEAGGGNGDEDEDDDDVD
jgi:hypothetical protein